ncbi:MAG: hypothetical protein K2N22_03855 [Clostridia bacterium]|nr:hypothetical protein [Clostridia bacterium]
MNKTKKIITAAVSVVMAGTMAASLAACGDNNKPNKPSGSGANENLMTKFEGYMDDAWKTAKEGYGSTESSSAQKKLEPKLENGKLAYSSKTTLTTALGYDGPNTGIKYSGGDDGNTKKLLTYLGGYEGSADAFQLYGNTYTAGNLKPAWKALSEKLDVTISDEFEGVKSGQQMSTVVGKGLDKYQLFTASATDINSQGADGNLLNITNYLDYMPNYKAFLEANPLARLSLTADNKGSMYMLPYFDGNDDIEKFVLLEKTFVEKLLDATTIDESKTITFKEQAEAKAKTYAKKGIVGNQTSVESFMGQTGSWKIEVTDPDALTTREDGKDWGNNLSVASKGHEKDVIEITVDYTAALNAAKDTTSELGKAVQAAAGKAYDGTSGNIVDLQNFAINAKNGDVKGSALLKILQEYIKVTYKKGNDQFYTKLSDVFNSAYAAWDVDLYTALGRCFVTCGGLIENRGVSLVKGTDQLFLLSAREYKANRYSDTYSMAGELYGVRGLETRYSPTYAYVNAQGGISDSRLDENMWNALDKMNKLAKEGLFNAMTDTNVGKTAPGWNSTNGGKNDGVQTLSLHDYCQTQTANKGFEVQSQPSGSSATFNFAPVLTPVSKWDDNGSGTADKYMRFTESWRGVKNTGWCISYKAVESDKDKLSATLALVDYFFSNDGQILMTYGPQGAANDAAEVADAKAANGGFWYGNKVTGTVAGVELAYGADGALTEASLTALKTANVIKTDDGVQYYANPGEKQANGTVANDYAKDYFVYKNALYTGTYYKGKQVPTLTNSSLAMFESDKLGNHSFTNYARHVIGSALNIGNKDQGFEYQCTSKAGIVGSDIVNIALVNGTIKHTEQLDPSTVTGTNWWYMLMPTLLPYSSRVNNVISKAPFTTITALGGASLFTVDGSTENFLNDVMAYGLGSGTAIRTMSNGDKIPDTAAGVIAYLNAAK